MSEEKSIEDRLREIESAPSHAPEESLEKSLEWIETETKSHPPIYKKRKRQLLDVLKERFTPGVMYSEEQAMSIADTLGINELGHDKRHLLRGMIDLGHLQRNPEGTLYFRPTETTPHWLTDRKYSDIFWDAICECMDEHRETSEQYPPATNLITSYLEKRSIPPGYTLTKPEIKTFELDLMQAYAETMQELLQVPGDIRQIDLNGLNNTQTREDFKKAMVKRLIESAHEASYDLYAVSETIGLTLPVLCDIIDKQASNLDPPTFEKEIRKYLK